MNYSKVVPLHQTSEAENGGAGQSPSFHEIMEAHPPPHVVCGDMDEVSSVASKSRFKAAGLAQVMSMDRNLHRAELQYYPGTPNSETMQSTAAQQLLVPSLREAFTVGQGGKGSALLPLLHCCAEQCCLYNRETRSWCCGGPLAYLHDGKRWKWESFLAPCFLLFIILEAVLAWQVLISSSDDSFGKWIRRPQNSWGIAAMIYINIAVGAFLPVGHAYLKPADYSKCSSEDAFEGDRKTITNVFKRRIFEYYPGIRDRSDRNSDAAGPTPEDVKIHSEQHADHCIAVRKKLEGALATWKKWVS